MMGKSVQPLFSKSKPHILLVIADRALADLISLTLQRMGCTVSITLKADEAMAELNASHPKVVVLDLFLPGWNGLDLLELMKFSGWLQETRVIVVSAMRAMEVMEQAVLLGASDFLVKPFDVELACKKMVEMATRSV